MLIFPQKMLWRQGLPDFVKTLTSGCREKVIANRPPGSPRVKPRVKEINFLHMTAHCSVPVRDGACQLVQNNLPKIGLAVERGLHFIVTTSQNACHSSGLALVPW